MKTDILINIDVEDLNKGISFYTQAFGLKVGRVFDGQWIELVGASSKIYLLQKKADSISSTISNQRRDYSRHWTPVHLDFVVDSMEQGIAQATAAGATFESDIKVEAYGRLIFGADPFGNGFCLIEFNPQGYDALVV